MPRLIDIAKNTTTRWADVQEMSGGAFSDIEPGAYVLTITSCTANPQEQYFEVAWDVAEGERKGAYAMSQYPPTTRLYWREKALGFLKHRLHVLADWNEGFKPTVAFEEDQWGQFVGKRFGAVVRRRLYTAGPNSKSPGADRHSMEVALWLNPADFEAKKFDPGLLADNDQRQRGAQAQPEQVAQVPQDFGGATAEQQTDVYDQDIPF